MMSNMNEVSQGSSYNGTQADNSSKSHETGMKSCLYPCRDNKQQGLSLQLWRCHILLDERRKKAKGMGLTHCKVEDE